MSELVNRKPNINFLEISTQSIIQKFIRQFAHSLIR